LQFAISNTTTTTTVRVVARRARTTAPQIQGRPSVFLGNVCLLFKPRRANIKHKPCQDDAKTRVVLAHLLARTVPVSSTWRPCLDALVILAQHPCTHHDLTPWLKFARMVREYVVVLHTSAYVCTPGPTNLWREHSYGSYATSWTFQLAATRRCEGDDPGPARCVLVLEVRRARLGAPGRGIFMFEVPPVSAAVPKIQIKNLLYTLHHTTPHHTTPHTTALHSSLLHTVVHHTREHPTSYPAKQHYHLSTWLTSTLSITTCSPRSLSRTIVLLIFLRINITLR